MINLFIYLLWISYAALYYFRRRTALIIYLVLLSIVPFYWAPVFIVPLNAITFQRILSIGLFAGLMMESVRDVLTRNINNKQVVIEILVFIMMIIWSISAFEITTISDALRILINNILDFWVPFTLAIRILNHVKDGTLFILKCIAWPAIIVGILTLCEYYYQLPFAWSLFNSLINTATDPKLWLPGLRSGVLRVQATLGHSIFLGFYLILTGYIFIIFGNLKTETKKVRNYLIGSFLFIVSFLPMVRGVIIAIIVALSLFYFLIRRENRWKVIIISLFAVISLWISAKLFIDVKSFWGDFANTILGHASSDIQAQQMTNWEARLNVVDTGLNFIRKAPLFGYGEISIGGTSTISDVVNVLVTIGIISGPIGLSIFILFVVILGIKLINLWLVNKKTENRIVVAGLIGLYTIIAISWFDASWPGQVTQIEWMLFGIILFWKTNTK